MIKVRRKLLFAPRDHGRQAGTETEPPAAAVPKGRIPRVSRLMALAILFDRFIREGKVGDQSELARLAHVSQPRMTQIMNLLHLAPDIQEDLLFLPLIVRGRETTHERTVRRLTHFTDWQAQRRQWRALCQVSTGCGVGDSGRNRRSPPVPTSQAR